MAWVDHYVDDYIETDTELGGTSCQEAVETTHQVLGHATEPTKRKYTAPEHVVLGVGVSLADVVRM